MFIDIVLWPCTATIFFVLWNKILFRYSVYSMFESKYILLSTLEAKNRRL